ncbi:hypothetical protein [Streptomyces nanshensis]|uniref:hypothetical protein n=1 Tax=Streptomyces nanshensis TaxID=518642 RepID=UPI00085C0537|nr:hypothetical protein [Streptomyces nanshensis]
MNKKGQSYSKVYAVLSALVELGPGMYTTTCLTRVCNETFAQEHTPADGTPATRTPIISRSSVERILSAGCDWGYLAYDASTGRFGLPQWAQPHSEPEEASLPTVTSGPLAHECRTLQRTTSQVVTAYALSIVDAPATRLMRHHEAGTRYDFTRKLAADPTARQTLKHATLGQDAAGLVILAHMAPPRTERLRMIRSEGYALSPSPVPGWETIAAPLWYGRSAMGALALHASTWSMRRNRSKYIHLVTRSAAGLSNIFDSSTAAAA